MSVCDTLQLSHISEVVWDRSSFDIGGGQAWGQKSEDLNLNLPFVTSSTSVPAKNP